MSLSAEQKQAVASWVTTGDNLSAIQKKLREQFQVSLTYMEVRFLIDDLNLALKDQAPKASADLNAAAAPKAQAQPAAAAHAPEDGLPPESDGLDDDLPPDADALPLDDADVPAGASSVSVSVDKITLIPGAVASGTVTFSDGVTGKWIVDHYGRPGFTEISQPGYRPTPADGQAFMAQLSQSLSRQGY
ncbi:hypothetical protein [Nibricoccus sp. IMCC34717]|uniref:hypothetical protein n=1 Tax=Nibricoccus sp. IMCC34717 TaxID=3034021 RepID=UPI00384E2C47